MPGQGASGPRGPRLLAHSGLGELGDNELYRDGRKGASELGEVGEGWKDWLSAGGGRSRGRRGHDPRGMCGGRGDTQFPVGRPLESSGPGTPKVAGMAEGGLNGVWAELTET